LDAEAWSPLWLALAAEAVESVLGDFWSPEQALAPRTSPRAVATVAHLVDVVRVMVSTSWHGVWSPIL
jgi:hypothetical protein